MGEQKRRKLVDYGSGGGDTPRLVEQQFEDWVKTVYDGPIQPDQRREVRRAFFSGVNGALRLLGAIADSFDGPITATEEATMQAIEVELDAFLRDVEAGRA